MAARGAWSKEQVWNKILETFPGSFVNEKEIRIPMIENGDRIEIKVTLTAAKTNVEEMRQMKPHREQKLQLPHLLKFYLLQKRKKHK